MANTKPIIKRINPKTTIVSFLCSVNVHYAQSELPHCTKNPRHAFLTDFLEESGKIM